MKHHPDRKTDLKDKEIAKQKFQEISQAYNVLRDRKYNIALKTMVFFQHCLFNIFVAKKRQLYDQGANV
jgi:hypothetical protein